MKKKVLFVNYNMIIGGSTTSLISLLSSLDKDRYDIDLLLYKNEGPLLNMIPKEVNLLPQAFKNYNSFIKATLFVLTGYARKSRNENAKNGLGGYSSQLLADYQAKYLSRKLQEKYDYAIGYLEGWADRYVAYNVYADHKIGWLHSTFRNLAPIDSLERSWMNKVNKIVCVSEACRKDFVDSMPEMIEKSLTIENILDSRAIKQRSLFDPKHDSDYEDFIRYEGFKIITICRLSIQTKGLDRIVKAAKMLKEKGRLYLWYIIGEGEDRERLEEMISNNSVGDCVKLIGKRDNPYPYIRHSDLMCMPSRWEGKPMIVTESLILGIPCLVTNYLSAKEQIIDRKTGFIVENTDNSIIDILLECVSNPKMIETMKYRISTEEYGNQHSIFDIEEQLFGEL